MPKHIISLRELKKRYSEVIIGIACQKWWLEIYEVEKIGAKVIKLITYLKNANRKQFMKTYKFYIKERRRLCITYLLSSQTKDVNSAMQIP